MFLPVIAAIILPQSIDFECKAERLGDVLKSLSKPLHEDFTATPELAERFQVLSVHGVSADELRAHLAKVNCAKWITYQGGERLVSDPDAEKAEQERNLSERIERLRRAQAALADDVAKMGPFGSAQAVALLGRMTQVDQAYEAEDRGGTPTDDSEKACENSPGQRAGKRIALLLDPAEIAALKGRVAYSDRPTSLQRLLSPKARQVIAQLAQEQKTWLGAFSDDPKFDARRSWMSVDPRGYKRPIDPETTRCFLKFKADDNQPYVEVSFVNPADEVLAFGFVRLDAPAPKVKVNGNTDPTTFEMPEDAKAFVVGLSQRTFQFPVQVGPEWHSVFLHPDKYEPLSYATSDTLLAASRAKKENLVAWVGDDAIDIGRFGWDGEDKPERVARFWDLLKYCNMRSEVAGSWRLVLPLRHENPIDRGAIAEMLRNLDATGGQRLAEAATFAASIGGDAEPGLVYEYKEAILPGAYSLVRTEWEVLRFYGLLRPVDRQALEDQKVLELKNISPEARQVLLYHLLNGGYSDLRRIAPDGRPIYGTGSNILSEPTELLGGGFDPDAFATQSRYRIKGVATFANDRYSARLQPNPMSLRDLAIQVLRPSMPQLANYDQLNGGEAKGVVPGFTSRIDLQFMLRKDLRYQMHLQDHEFDLRRKPMAITELPADYAGELQKATEEVKRQYSGAGG